MSRQKQVLAVLAVVFVLALAYAFWASPRPEEVATTTVEPPAPRRPVAEGPADAPAGDSRVRLDLLTRERERFAGYQRDIFNYPRVAPPPPKIVKPPVAPPPPPLETIEPAPVPPEVERELASFTFLGFLEKENVKTIFLSSGEEIFLVKKGESFGKGNEFHVSSLTPEMLVIRRREDPRTISIPLVEQAPLVPLRPRPPIRPFSRPFSRFGADAAPSEDQGGAAYPGEMPVEPEEDWSPPPPEGEDGFPPAVESSDVPGDEGNGLTPPPAEGENGYPPGEESSDEPPSGEEGETENDMSPPGGAANE
ncbi:hypothetical protein [Desulfuromonas sp. TF]|uniref:hypothetical protein n=1 Tax=Desulfuromonas sp. TF TaxID=1232410 RepID=UPI000412F6ED|nr:hypothetical protein [Desulfuromonas sp. TF]